MSIKNFLTKLLRYPFKKETTAEVVARDFPDGNSIDMTDKEIDELLDGFETLDLDDEDESSLVADAKAKAADELLKSLPDQAKQFILREKIVKMKNGEVLLAQVLFTHQNHPVITQHGSVQFITLTAPVVIKTMYIPNLSNGTMNTHHIFEEWISNTKEPSFPVDVASIQNIAIPLPDVINSYRLFTTKNRMYKLNPTLAEHVFEMPYMDVPENYNVEMTEISDDELGDDTQHSF